MKYIISVIRNLKNWKAESVKDGICDFSGQGRDKYGN